MTINRKLTVIFLMLAMSLGYPRVNAQSVNSQPTPPSQPRPFQIRFFAPIDYNTINQLMGAIDQQLKAGTTDFYILLSSPGGDPSAAFAAYTYLHGIPANVTTFNMGNVDSAANLIYCAGKNRYAPPGTRFLIHGASYGAPAGMSLDIAGLDAQSAQVKNLNAMMVQVLNSATKNKNKEIESAVHGQAILSAEEAKDWGLVQEVRTTFVVPGAVLASISGESEGKPETKYPTPFTSISGDSITDTPPPVTPSATP